MMISNPEETEHDEWTPVSALGLTGYALTALVILWLAHDGQRWVFFLDGANLVFHEAGHPLLGMLVPNLAVYGGTLGQLVFPVAAAITFFRQGATLSVAFAVLWIGENLFNIARYMADARTQILPLVGGGKHDWTEIFSRWGMLGSDTTIAGFVRLFGWILIVGAGFWLWRRHARKLV